MSQKLFGDVEVLSPKFTNVGENWKLYDTVLIGDYAEDMDFHVGYFTTYAALGAANVIPFFNVRNRNHGLAYNNQDTRDQLPYVFHIYSIGVTFWTPSTTDYAAYDPAIVGAQVKNHHIFSVELPKHASLLLKTNQDERVELSALMAPAGYGIAMGGLAQGDPEASYTYPNVSHFNFNQGIAEWGNVWGFRKPLEIPRTANLSVEINFSEYARQLLQGMIGPHYQPMQDVANDNSFFGAASCSGIQVTLQGKREVQQRGQYHA